MSRKHVTCGPIRVSFSYDADTNELLAIYLKLSDHKIKKTLELAEDTLVVDVGYRGDLVGVEILAPCRVQLIGKLAQEYNAPRLQKFIKNKRVAQFLQPA